MVSIGVSCIKCPVVCSFRPMCWLAGNLLAHIVVAHANSSNTNNIVVVVESPHEGVDAVDVRNNSMNSIDWMHSVHMVNSIHWVHSIHSRDIIVDSITLVVDCRAESVEASNWAHSIDSRMDVGGNIITVMNTVTVMVVDHRADVVHNRADSVNSNMCSLVDVVDRMVWVGDHLGLSISRALPID